MRAALHESRGASARFDRTVFPAWWSAATALLPTRWRPPGGAATIAFSALGPSKTVALRGATA